MATSPDSERAARAAARRRQRFRTFVIVWAGQLVSLLGSGMSFFALGYWTFVDQYSVTSYALLVVFSQVPGILLAPLAGSVTDRFDRRHVMMASDGGAAVAVVVAFALLLTGALRPWHLYLLMLLHSVANAFQWSAYSAATTLLVPRRRLARANGMVQMAQSSTRIAAPALAGWMVGRFDERIEILLLVDLVTFAVALTTLAAVRFPRPKAVLGSVASKGFRNSARFGWTYIRQRQGLVLLLLFFAAVNITLSFTQVLSVPVVLGFSSVDILGQVLAVGGVGMLAGSILMSVWNGPRRRIPGILACMILSGLGLAILGARPHILAVSAGLFLMSFITPIVISLNQAVWQSKVPAAFQGRVFAIRRMIAWSTLPIGYFAAGPLADRVFEPLLAANGAWASTLGPLVGTGPGRGAGVMLVALGALTVLSALGFLGLPRLRRLEAEIPDVLEAEETTGSGYNRPAPIAT